MNILKFEKCYRKDLTISGYSISTINNYCSQVKCFLNYFNTKKEPKYITTDEIKDYLLRSKQVNSQRHVHSALKKFYNITIGQPRKMKYIEYAKIEKSLPQVIDKNLILDSINKIDNLKHKAVITLAFSTGMRVSEVCNLKISDIDSNRKLIMIMKGKGRKDRIVPLSNTVLDLLRNYYKEYKPKEFLFNGQTKPKYSPRSCNQIVKKYLGNNYHFHQLRHSNATALLEAGTDIRIIQKILGHSNVKTTEIYTHVSNQLLNKVNLPI